MALPFKNFIDLIAIAISKKKPSNDLKNYQEFVDYLRITQIPFTVISNGYIRKEYESGLKPSISSSPKSATSSFLEPKSKN